MRALAIILVLVAGVVLIALGQTGVEPARECGVLWGGSGNPLETSASYWIEPQANGEVIVGWRLTPPRVKTIVYCDEPMPLGVRSDFDGDGDVDLADLFEFQKCFNGPNRPAKCG